LDDIKQQKRVNDILLGPLERPALRWLAAHMPMWVNSDMMTVLGVIGSVLIFASYILTNISPHFLWLACLGFVINWFGDSLDGTLARYRNKQRPKFGFFVDHTTDALSQMIVFLGLGLSPYVQFEIAALGLVAYLLMSILAYVTTIVTGTFQISYSRIGATEMRVIAIILNVLIFFFAQPLVNAPFGYLTFFDFMLLLIIAYFLIFYTVTIIVRGVALSKVDLAQSASEQPIQEQRVPSRQPATKKGKRSAAGTQGNKGQGKHRIKHAPRS